MAVFRDETGRRARAVKSATWLGALVAVASLAAFVVSVSPVARKPVLEEPAPAAKGPPPPGTHADQRAREAEFKKESARLNGLVAEATAAQKKRPPSGAPQPVLAGFVVNWDPASLASLQLHADQLTHAMPEWVRAHADGSFSAEEDARVREAAARLELVPTVSNYGDNGFERALALPFLKDDSSRKEGARKLAALCEEHTYAGINLDFEELKASDEKDFALFVEAIWAELHPRGYLVTVDVPADPKGIEGERLARATDFLVVMAYDEHASTDDPGPIASPRTVASSAAGWLTHVPADHLVVALGAYGYDWPLDSDGDAAKEAEELGYSQALALARENEVPIDWDKDSKSSHFEYDDDDARVKHAVWFLDAPASLAQLQSLQQFHLRGSAIWRLGAEDPKLFGLFGKSPGTRSFDPQAARAGLDGIIANDATDVQTAGEGELITVKGSPQPGKRAVSFAPDGSIQSVDYQQYPSGWILERRGGKPPDKVALTFDDGPDEKWTPQLLDILKKRNTHAAFFLIGENAQANAGLVRREVAEGHLIGNHSFTHPDLSLASPLRFDLELNTTERLLEWLSGQHTRLLRPPYYSDGSLDDPAQAAVIARAGTMGYLVLGLDIDPEDFSMHDPQEITRRVLAQAKNGSVILLHDGGGDRSGTVAALPMILDGLAAQGIQVVDPAELTGMTRAELMTPAGHAARDKLVAAGDSIVFGVLSTIASVLSVCFMIAIGLLALRGVILAIAAPLQARRARKAGLGEVPKGPGGAPLTVSVVVPGYNEEKVICRTVDSLLEQEPPVLEVVCVDDGSTDRTLAVLRERFDGHPRVRVLTKLNGGKSSALNVGFREARGDIVVALDSDTLFAPETVAMLTAPFSDPGVAAVAGNAKVGNRVNYLTRWQALEYVTAQNLERRAWDLAAAVPIVPGAVGAWRRSKVLELGGYHEDTLAEDTDLTLRLLADGNQVVYADRALAFTEAPETVKQLLKQRFRWTYGILQACWKYKSRFLHPGGGVLGWGILPAFAIYQFLVPLIAPVVDLLFVVSLLRGQAMEIAGYYLLFFALDLMLSAVAVLLEGEDLKLLLGLFVQRVAYRQILWVALARSIWSAMSGFTVGWGKLARTGSVAPAPRSLPPRGVARASPLSDPSLAVPVSDPSLLPSAPPALPASEPALPPPAPGQGRR